MALPASKLEEILHLLPEETHGKTKYIFEKIPGSLVKFLNPTHIEKKVECRESDLTVNPSQPMGSVNGSEHRARGQPGWVPCNARSQDSYESKSRNQTPTECPVFMDYENRYANALHGYLLGSIKKAFRSQNITEVSPDSFADDIKRQCLAQCPDWGRKRCETPSVIVRLESRYICKQEARSFTVNTYTYAYLACEHRQSYIPFVFAASRKINFEVNIELNGIEISLDRIEQFRKLLTDLSLEQVIERIERTDKVTWKNLDQQNSQASAGHQAALSWDDL